MTDTSKRNHRDHHYLFTEEEGTWPEDAEKKMIKIGDGQKTLGFEDIFFILKGSGTPEQMMKCRKEYKTKIF